MQITNSLWCTYIGRVLLIIQGENLISHKQNDCRGKMDEIHLYNNDNGR